MQAIVSPPIEAYCAAHTTAASPMLEEVEDYTRRNCENAQMLVGPLEAALLQLLVRASGARRILEIGTFTGYSALAMAAALPEDGSLLTCDIDPGHAEIANGFFARSPLGRKITLRLGPALQTLAALPAEAAFDFVFIDADKENYGNYYEAVLPRLHPGGLILADNVLWYGRVLDPKEASDKAIVAFNRRVAGDARVEAVMLPLRDGVYVIRKRSDRLPGREERLVEPQRTRRTQRKTYKRRRGDRSGTCRTYAKHQGHKDRKPVDDKKVTISFASFALDG